MITGRAAAQKTAKFSIDVYKRQEWLDSEELNGENVKEKLAGCNGILIPGGFGTRGIEGKIEAAKYAREQNIPFLGICLGMQVAVIEYARNVLGYRSANSREFDETNIYSVIDLMPEQIEVDKKGGTMRLGVYPCRILPDSIMQRAYGEEKDVYKRQIFPRYRPASIRASQTSLLSGGIL